MTHSLINIENLLNTLISNEIKQHELNNEIKKSKIEFKSDKTLLDYINHIKGQLIMIDTVIKKTRKEICDLLKRKHLRLAE